MSAGPNAVPLTVENLGDWEGQDVVDTSGEKLGKLEDVYYDAQVDQPAFIAVKSGLLGKKVTLVPVGGASVTRAHVRVQHGKEQVKDAPSFDPDVELTPEDEASTYGYYGHAYAAPSGGGRMLAKH